eukprot:3683318-Prymnesium_polylepis.1
MTGGWYDAAVAAVEAVGPAAAVYFVIVLVINCYLILNLFVAILLEAFATGDEEKENEEEGEAADDKDADTSARASASRRGSRKRAMTQDEKQALFKQQLEAYDPADSALSCIGSRNPLRRFARAVMLHDSFEMFIIFVIFASSVCLAIDNPRLDPDSELAAYIRQLDLVWTAIFTTEAALKIVALGFACNGPRSYLTDPWNVLDFAI